MRHLLGFIFIVLIFSCNGDRSERNPFLQEIGFRFDLNLNLPEYSPLTNTGNAIYVDNVGVGTRGAFVINIGFNQFRVFEASCPNHAPNSCSTTELSGQTAICSCEDYEYSLFTGQLLNKPEGEGRFYDMLEYRATISGNVVTISN
ncbi:hypothetical protein [Spongiimicrobium sp. 3-5]|uniref:hypothetical protein n=1 Tax=Spongiimicrobium sp. 3-5 TaxID=3332596 RepID=UPI003980CDD5